MTDCPNCHEWMYCEGITENPPFVHEIQSADDKDGTMMLWHCGAGATRLAVDPSSITLQQQYAVPIDPANKGGSMGGVTLDFWVKLGRATIAQLGGAGERFAMHTASGEILPPRKDIDLGVGRILARALIKIDSPEKFVKEALGHQFVTVHGDVRDVIEELCDLVGIRLVKS